MSILTQTIAAAIVLGGGGLFLDELSEPPVARDYFAESRAEDMTQCQRQHGPHSVAVFGPDGSHRCYTKRGYRLAEVTP